MQLSVTEVISLVSGIGALILAITNLIKGAIDAKNIEDQVNDRIWNRAKKEIDSMQKQLDSQQCEITEVKADNRRLRMWVKLLCDQVVKLGGVPVPAPKDVGNDE